MEDTKQGVSPDTLNEGEVEKETLNPSTGDDSQSTSTEVGSEPEPSSEEQPTPEDNQDTEQLKKLVENYKIRAEKAERKLKQLKKNLSPTPQVDVKDIAALVKANVPEEDYDDIFDYARLKNISVSEALKSPVIQALLRERQEQRETAKATAVSNKPAGPVTPSGEQLLARAKKTGEIPEDEAALQKLVEARLKTRKG